MLAGDIQKMVRDSEATGFQRKQGAMASVLWLRFRGSRNTDSTRRSWPPHVSPVV